MRAIHTLKLQKKNVELNDLSGIKKMLTQIYYCTIKMRDIKNIMMLPLRIIIDLIHNLHVFQILRFL